jgi:ribosome biogenesis GTPase / thiamine phosphate phosphatase
MKNIREYEESDFFSDDLKLSRKERKLITKKDRSKYKKTDSKKEKKQSIESRDHLSRGTVISILGQEIIVEGEDGKQVVCTLRGSFKKERMRIKNLVIVGDMVFFTEEKSIVAIEERKKVLSRADHLSQKKEHLICANVDMLLLVVSLLDPPLRLPLIDRYLIAAEKGGLDTVIICNKIDLLDDASYTEQERLLQQEKLEECRKIYKSIGVPFLEVSAKTGAGIEAVKELMKNKISVFSGQSGSGKSSLINAICSLDLRVGKTVESSRKGSHTTTSAILLPLTFGGFVVDTPGIKSFGVWNVTPQDVRWGFPDIVHVGKKCKFQDCSHRGEMGCAVPEALEKGKLSPLRYESYLNLLTSVEEEHLRR